MTLWEQIASKAMELPPEKQAEVLDFVEFLAAKRGPKAPLKSPMGIWKGKVDVTDEDIAEARREMWGNFPREFPAEDDK